jgi:PrtD family type I secretion system ABC transporter
LPALIATALFSTMINLLMFIGPIYMLQIYDRVLSSRNIGTLVALTGIAVFLLITYALLDFFRSRVLVRAGVRFDDALRGPLFRATLLSALATRSSAAAQMLREMDVVREFRTGSAFITLCDAPFAPIFGAVCFLFHPYLGLVALAGAGVLFTMALLNEYLTRGALQSAGRASSDAAHFATSSVRNVEVIHALGMHDAVRERWGERHLDHLGWQAKASDRAGVIMSATKAFRQFLQVAILGVGAWLAIQREISPGMMVAASIMMGRALSPVEHAVGQWKAFLGARSAWSRLEVLFEEFAENLDRTELPPPKGHLTVENLSVAAPGRKTPILKNISFDLPMGQALAIIGPSGSGKSTLARALVGVWPPAQGLVRLDGSDLRHWKPERLGHFIGYLPQDIELFAGTVAENIARLRRVGDAKDIFAAAQVAGVHPFILSLPDGYDTQIGEAGAVLSGGQRQRIGLARALFMSPRIVVLDEPNAHLDSSGESELVQALLRLKTKGNTVVLVTHKPTLLAICDWVIVLSDGAVRTYGSAAQVLRQLTAPRIVADQSAQQGTSPKSVAAGRTR